MDDEAVAAVGNLSTSLGPVAFTRTGRGPAVVLLHGNPGDARDWDAVLAALAAHHTVIRLDWPGYGRSPAPRGPVGAPAFARILGEVLDRLDVMTGVPAGVGASTPVVLIGHSVGGYAAVRQALERPDRVAALVLVAPGGFTRFRAPTRWFVRRIGSVRSSRHLVRPLASAFVVRRTASRRAVLRRVGEMRAHPQRLAVHGAVWRSFLDPEHDLRARAARVSVPVLLTWGRLDPVVPWPADGRRAARLLPGARVARFWCGHLPHAEVPEQWSAAVLPFLQAVSRASGAPAGTAVTAVTAGGRRRG